MAWPVNEQPFSANRTPILNGLSSVNGIDTVPVAVDPATGAVLTEGGGGSGGATTIADGSDIAEGATTDAAVTAGNAGTISGKLRQISGDISSGNSTQATSANQTNGNQQTKITDGTNTANVLKSDGTAAGQNGQLVAGAYKELTGLSVSSLNGDLVPSTDVSGYRWISLQMVPTALVGTITFQGSNDNTNWFGVILSLTTAGSASTFSTTTANGLFYGPVNFRYFRVRMTAYTSGSVAGVCELSTIAPGVQPPVTASQQIGTWLVSGATTTGSAVPNNAFFVAGQNGSGNLQAFRMFDAGEAASLGNISAAGQYLYNGTTADRSRNNETTTLLASAARTTTQTSADLVNYNGLSALDVILNVTSAGTGSITLSINGKDSASGTYYSLLTGLAVTTNSTNRYRINPYLASAANSVAQDVLPRIFQVVVTAGNANSVTYSVGYNLSRGV